MGGIAAVTPPRLNRYSACIEDMPSLVELQKKLGDKVTILAVSEDADENAVKQFVPDHNVDLMPVRDTGSRPTLSMARSNLPKHS